LGQASHGFVDITQILTPWTRDALSAYHRVLAIAIVIHTWHYLKFAVHLWFQLCRIERNNHQFQHDKQIAGLQV